MAGVVKVKRQTRIQAKARDIADAVRLFIFIFNLIKSIIQKFVKIISCNDRNSN
jgi:hypothetical protein